MPCIVGICATQASVFHPAATIDLGVKLKALPRHAGVRDFTARSFFNRRDESRPGAKSHWCSGAKGCGSPGAGGQLTDNVATVVDTYRLAGVRCSFAHGAGIQSQANADSE